MDLGQLEVLAVIPSSPARGWSLAKGVLVGQKGVGVARPTGVLGHGGVHRESCNTRAEGWGPLVP